MSNRKVLTNEEVDALLSIDGSIDISSARLRRICVKLGFNVMYLERENLFAYVSENISQMYDEIKYITDYGIPSKLYPKLNSLSLYELAELRDILLLLRFQFTFKIF